MITLFLERAMDQFEFISAVDQWPVTYFRWPAASAKAIVVISHGMAEHVRRYQRFAAGLNKSGFEVWGMDHRAHGLTSGPAGLGDFGEGGWDALVEDIGQLIELAKGELPDLPLALFGHSMGAAAAQQFAPTGSQAIDALVLSGSTLRNPGEEIPSYNVPFEPARTEYDWLSRDPVEVDDYINDPLCGFEGQTVINGMDRTDPRRVDPHRLARIRPDLPVLLVAGDADPVNNNLAGIDFLEEKWRDAGVQQIDRQIYSGGRHEMLNETNRDEVTRKIIDWLDQALSARC